jgi:hypothetical protein
MFVCSSLPLGHPSESPDSRSWDTGSKKTHNIYVAEIVVVDTENSTCLFGELIEIHTYIVRTLWAERRIIEH